MIFMNSLMNDMDIDVLVGKTITHIFGLEKGSGLVTFLMDDGMEYQMTHDQDCCENVEIEDIIGDVGDLIGYPILMSLERSNYDDIVPDIDVSNYESYTWTFYRFSTIQGTVVIRWLGTSNGYYSEKVTFCESKKK